MGNMEAEERKEEGTPSGETLEAAFGKLDQMLETLESSDGRLLSFIQGGNGAFERMQSEN